MGVVPRTGESQITGSIKELIDPKGRPEAASLVMMTFLTTEPPDADVANGQMVFWLDPSPIQAKLWVKCRNSLGVIKKGSLNLS